MSDYFSCLATGIQEGTATLEKVSSFLNNTYHTTQESLSVYLSQIERKKIMCRQKAI